MRASGILLHISSLPNPYGIGTFGESSYRFVDFLHASGQKYWQVLPLGTTSYGDSPYQNFSAFAGNPYYIDFDLLKQEGLLTTDDYAFMATSNHKYVDYAFQYQNRFRVLKMAFERFKTSEASDYQLFCQTHPWLDDFALFMSLKKYHNDQSWINWDLPYRLRDSLALGEFSQQNHEEISFWKFIQYTFYKQYLALKKYANDLGVEIIGDMPIYVAYDSADVWASPKYWQLGDNLNPTHVAGCPPDAFSVTGQLWGNPLYNYDLMEQDGYKWWIDRLKEALKLYDIVRIDHFRGFEAYYAIPASHQTAEFGKWVKGPGSKLFKAIKVALGEVKVIAEDLGYITENVKALLTETGFPGMNVLQFAFSPFADNQYLPHHHKQNSVAYTGTHDNYTTRSWFNQLPEFEKNYVMDYLDASNEDEIVERLIRLCLGSPADTAIIPIQDYLGLGDEGRFNVPSSIGGNWTWRLAENQLTVELQQKILKLTKIYKRLSN